MEATEAPLLQAALEARISIGRDRTGRLVPVIHCRKAREGCERRLAEFAGYLISASQTQKLDTWLIAAIALKESGLNPFARGGIGELGILQINPKRRDASRVRFMRDPTYREQCRNLPGACQREIVFHAAHILREALTMCRSNLVNALGAYNTGRCGGNPAYADRVLRERSDLLRAVGLDPVVLARAAAPNRS
jgi:soluble lytic murein transglycosylase-like protein